MRQTLGVPACHNYITAKGVPDYQRLFGLTKTAYQTKYPKKEINDEQIYEHLQSEGILPPDCALSEIDTTQKELCFTIISEFKCNFICQLCAYSPLYKNEYESEEALILAYALKSWDNLSYLLCRNIHFQNFRALILLRPESAVATLPLHRLAFEYLEHLKEKPNIFTTLPLLIIQALEKNNKNKLAPADIFLAQTYLTNLRDEYVKTTQKQIDRLLQKCFHIKPLVETSPTQMIQPTLGGTSPSEKEPPATAEESVCLTGFLTDSTANSHNTPAPTPATIPPVEKINTPRKTAETTQENNVFEKSKKTHYCSTKAAAEEKRAPNKGMQKTDFQVSIKQTSVSTYKTRISDKNSGKEKKETSTYAFSFSPIFSKKDVLGYPFEILDKASEKEIDSFLKSLLFTPLLPFEVVIDQESKQEYALIYANHIFYYLSGDAEDILNQMVPYLAKSHYRKLICFEPYRLYHFLHEKRFYYGNLFSLFLAYRTMQTEINAEYHHPPEQIISQYTGKKNTERLPSVLFAMQNYRKMFDSICNNIIFQKPEVQEKYVNENYLASFFGISYHLSNVLLCNKVLFDDSDKNFNYKKGDKLKEGYYAVTYHLSSEKGVPSSLVTDLLLHFATQHLPDKFHFRLLSFGQQQFTIATTISHYKILCEVVNNIVTFLAERMNILPIYIDEDVQL